MVLSSDSLFYGGSFRDIGLAIGILNQFFRLGSSIPSLSEEQDVLDQEVENIVENGDENNEKDESNHHQPSFKKRPSGSTGRSEKFLGMRLALCPLRFNSFHPLILFDLVQELSHTLF